MMLISLADVTEVFLNKLALFSEYSAAATCENNFNSTEGTKVVCDPGICPHLERTDTEILTSFQGYVALRRITS
jgi:hypothetical protein